MKDSRKNELLVQVTSLVAAAAIILSGILFRHLQLNTVLRFCVALLPIAIILYFFYTFMRFIRGLDELQQKIQLLALSFAFGLTCVITFTVGMLQMAGVVSASLEWYYVYVIMLLIYAAVSALIRRQYR